MKIVFGTDLSVHANEAALAAAALVARAGGTLTLVHVLDSSRYINPSKDLMDHLRDSRQKKLDWLTERVKRRGAKVEASVVEGTPGTKLAEIARRTQAQLLVVSSSGPVVPTRWLSGSVADQTVQSSSVPTLVIRKARAFREWAYSKRPLKVLVGYDFSATSEAALRWAASLREIAPCELTVAYVASPANERARLGIEPAISSLHYPSGIKRFLERELKQKCDTIVGENGANICVKADWGRPGSHLIEVADEERADLLVVGTSQRRGMARLGSISRAVSHYAHMNVACVPTSRVGHATSLGLPQFNRVLVPIDFAVPSEQAIAHAYASVRSGGEVHLLHVTTRNDRDGTAPRGGGNGDSVDRELSARLESLIPALAESREITTRREVRRHYVPASAICQAANRIDADLICMGSRGRSRLKETLFGSVSQDVMTRSDRAVFVVQGSKRTATKHEPTEFGG